jgi:hypothetical protein
MEFPMNTSNLPAGASGSVGDPEPRLGWNLIWYVPVCIWFCAYFLLRNLSNAWRFVVLIHERWSWGFFISPSSAVFVSAILFSLSYPIQSLLLIRGFLLDTEVGSPMRRYSYAAATVVGTFALALIVEAVIWGSFPLDVDAKGIGHLRLIPFVPWPDRPYGSY